MMAGLEARGAEEARARIHVAMGIRADLGQRMHYAAILI
jgi:hypothetical protein